MLIYSFTVLPFPPSFCPTMDTNNLHIVMLAWLALGHLFPFLELSKCLARHGHRISFLTTPNNVQRLLPTIPPDLLPLLKLLPIPLPHVDHLPVSAEATIDLPSDDLRPYLRIAFDSLSDHLSRLLQESPPPDWVIYDYAAYWVPAVVARFNVPCAFFSLFNAWTLSFSGPPSVLRGEGGARTTPEQFTEVPDWVPFPSTVAFKPYEARAFFAPVIIPDASGVSESYRFAAAIDGCNFVAIRSCRELEPDWLDLLGELYQKTIIPVGLLQQPPAAAATDDKWDGVFEWLDKQEPGSVLYAAFGSEVKLTSEQLREIVAGLELSGLPYVCAARGANSLSTTGRGLVCQGWVPQVRILGHPSVGGFLTHCGWNSIVEGIAAGVAPVLLPQVFDQGLNARILVEREIGVEIVRNEEDGSFTGEGIAKSLRLVMVGEEGERFRLKARECKDKMFGDKELQDRYMGEFVKYLCDQKQQRAATPRGRGKNLHDIV